MEGLLVCEVPQTVDMEIPIQVRKGNIKAIITFLTLVSFISLVAVV